MMQVKRKSDGFKWMWREYVPSEELSHMHEAALMVSEIEEFQELLDKNLGRFEFDDEPVKREELIGVAFFVVFSLTMEEFFDTYEMVERAAA